MKKKTKLPKASMGKTGSSYPQELTNNISGVSNLKITNENGKSNQYFDQNSMNIMSYGQGMPNDTSFMRTIDNNGALQQDFLQTNWNNPDPALRSIPTTSTYSGGKYGQMSPEAQALFKTQVQANSMERKHGGKVKNKKNTFKMQNGGRIVEMHNSHRANIQHLIDSDGDVDGYIMKYGGKLPKAELGTTAGLENMEGAPKNPKTWKDYNAGLAWPEQPQFPAPTGQQLEVMAPGQDAPVEVAGPGGYQFGAFTENSNSPKGIDVSNQVTRGTVDPAIQTPGLKQLPQEAYDKQNAPSTLNVPKLNPKTGKYDFDAGWGDAPKRDKDLGAVPLPYYAGKIKSFGEDRAYAKKILANNPSPWDEKAAKRAVGMDTAGMVAAGVGQGLQDIQKTLSPISGGISSMNALRDRQMVNASKKKDAADVNTYAGSDSGLKMSKHGSKVTGANMGGYDDPRNVGDTQLRDSRDFNAENNDGEANVNTQAGEAYADVATGSVGPILDSDGGMTGDQHGPEGTGGIDQVFSPGSGIITKEHTKSVGAMLEAFQNFPEIQKRIIGMGKTEMTDADLALQYATKPLEKQQMVILKDRVKIGKDQVKEKDKRDWGVDLPAARTRELNLQTLSSMEQKKKEEHDKLDQEIAYNNAIVRGPIYDNMRQGQREGLHGKALAEKVKKEDKEFRMKSEFGNKIPVMDPGGLVGTVQQAIGVGKNPMAPPPQLVIDDIVETQSGLWVHSKTGMTITPEEYAAYENANKPKSKSKLPKGTVTKAPARVVNPIDYTNTNLTDPATGKPYPPMQVGNGTLGPDFYPKTTIPVNHGVDATNNYSRASNPLSEHNAIDYSNLRGIFEQFGQREEVQQGYYDDLAAGLEKGDRELTSVMKSSDAYGQHLNDHKLYGDVWESDLIKMDNDPLFTFARNIARKHGWGDHFRPVEDPKDPRFADSQLAIEEYENAVNEADRANGTADTFSVEKGNKQPFGQRKFGNHHISIVPHVSKSNSIGPANDTPQTTYDENMPIVYKNTHTVTTKPGTPDPCPSCPDGTVPARLPDGTCPPCAGKKIETPKRRGYYSEGLNPWQTAGEFAAMLDPYEAAPYIEDKGASNALAANTRGRYMDIQPQLNRLTRGTKAQTRLTGASPIDQARSAQAYANEYEAAGQAYGQKYNADAQIDQNFNNTQNELMMRAGANKAAALNLLADRSAKGHSAFEDRWINAISGIGTKKVAQQAENRASILYQDMFPGYGYNGQYTTNRNGNPNLKIGYTPGSSGTRGGTTADQLYALDQEKLRIKYQQDLADEDEKALKAKASKKYGGKAKLPKKSPKRK